MRKNYIIYLLALVMALVPVCAFADTDEVTEGVPSEETVQSEALMFNGNDPCYWVNEYVRDRATTIKGGLGETAVGLFKAQRAEGGLGLYFADNTGIVNRTEGPRTVISGEQYEYTKIADETTWRVVSGSSYTYLFKQHVGNDVYAANVLEGIETAGGQFYYIKNGHVRTEPGLVSFGGKLYYIQPNAMGAIRTAEGFITDGGLTYYVPAGTNGAIRTVEGVFISGGKVYVSRAGGSICTNPGLVAVGGKLYYVMDATGVLAVNQALTVSGKTYHVSEGAVVMVGPHKWGKSYYCADDYGVVRTKKGFVKYNGGRAYVKKGGKIYVNKKFKIKKKYYIADETGKIHSGFFTWKKNLYYASDKGVLRTKSGFFSVNGYRYYTRKGGKLNKNKSFKVGGKTYRAYENGRLATYYYAWNNALYFADGKGALRTKQGLFSYNNKTYYNKNGGGLAVNSFVTDNGKHYYVGKDGAVITKQFSYNGFTITPNSVTGEISVEDYTKIFPDAQ